MAELPGEGWVGWADDADGQPAGLEHGQGLLQVGAAEGVEDDVVAAEHVGEVLLGVVDDVVGAEPANPFLVVGVGGGGDVGAEVLGHLDDRGPEPAGAGVDEDLLAGLDVGHVDQGLPRGQRHERDGAGFFERQRPRLEGHVVGIDGDELGEGPDPQVTRPGVHLVAHREAAHVGTHLGDHSRDVVSQDERPLVLQELLELAVTDHGVQRVDAGRPDVDQHVPGAHEGDRYVAQLERVGAVAGEGEGFHSDSWVGVKDGEGEAPAMLIAVW